MTSVQYFIIIFVIFIPRLDHRCLKFDVQNNMSYLDIRARLQDINFRQPLLYAITADDPRKPNVISPSPNTTSATITSTTTVDSQQKTTSLNGNQSDNIMTTSSSTSTTWQANTVDPADPNEDGPLSSTMTTNFETTIRPPNSSKPSDTKQNIPKQTPSPSPGSVTDLGIILYSAFIVYISFVKLIYHNISMIKRRFTEPGVLMIFGMIWELVLRRLVQDWSVLPRFNSRIFFYLFLPSTILDSASMLANKWLFLNMLSILMISISGTLLYAASIGYTIYFLSQDSHFNVYFKPTIPEPVLDIDGPSTNVSNQSILLRSDIPIRLNQVKDQVDASQLGFDLDLIDCLVFGTILSSIDSTTLLNAFRLNQVNEKLYYLALGENLMNNAVVLVIFNILLDFLNVTKLTVLKIYFSIMQFFVTLIGAIFIGLILAVVALISTRLIQRYQKQSSPTSYQSQCLAMIEVLLILKLAYFSYTLTSLAGTSSILGLATFGVLQDQYIKVNLSVRSQFTLRQVIYATKTLGHSLVYPLIGMLLVEVAHTSQFFYQAWLSLEPNIWNFTPKIVTGNTNSSMLISGQDITKDGSLSLLTSSESYSKKSQIGGRDNLHWNFKLLSLVTLITLVYRFVVVILLSQLSNILSARQLRIRLREQVLLAFGSLKGPLALALVHRLIENDEYREKNARNKHLFIYTISFITFVSNIIKGSFVGPLVERLRLSLCHSTANISLSDTHIVFNEISCIVTDHATHGLNNILGRKKSSYDRFVEFNETHIKPWLSGRSSHKNWLSIFYDNLILEEIMNANSFHLSIQETARVLANKESLNDIEGGKSEKMSYESGLIERNSKTGAALSGLSTKKQAKVAINENLRQRSESALLRELILFNLKQQESRARRRGTQTKRVQRNSRSKVHSQYTKKKSTGQLMLSTSSSSDYLSYIDRTRPKGNLNTNQQVGRVEQDSQRKQWQPVIAKNLTATKRIIRGSGLKDD